MANIIMFVVKAEIFRLTQKENKIDKVKKGNN